MANCLQSERILKGLPASKYEQKVDRMDAFHLLSIEKTIMMKPATIYLRLPSSSADTNIVEVISKDNNPSSEGTLEGKWRNQ